MATACFPNQTPWAIPFTEDASGSGRRIMDLLLKFLGQIIEAVLSINYPSTWDPTGLSRWPVITTPLRERRGRGFDQFPGLPVGKNGTLVEVGLSGFHSGFRLPTWFRAELWLQIPAWMWPELSALRESHVVATIWHCLIFTDTQERWYSNISDRASGNLQ